jgi:NADPH2:quinone reductase
MQALVADPTVASGMRLADVTEPAAGANQVVIDVRHVSLNLGDLNDARSGRVPAGEVVGSDTAGVVRQEAADGSGPPLGARVLALTRRAFAERAAIDVTSLAEVPDSVDLAEMAALPVAGLAALRALRAAGPVLGKRVLITGASGGVGLFAVQLAARAGADVVASTGSDARALGLAGSGANQVTVGLEQIDQPVDVILDTVGGSQMVEAWQLLAPGGNLQSIGWASREPAVFPPYATVGPAKALSSFLNNPPYAADLAILVKFSRDEILRAQIGWRGPLDRFADAVDALLSRSVRGKAILDVSPGG